MKVTQACSFLIALAGFVGVVGCVVFIAASWYVCSQLHQANDRVFEVLDGSLAAVRTRVLDSQAQVQRSATAAEELGGAVQGWEARSEVPQLAARLQLADQADRLALALQEADQWLRVSVVSLQGLEEALQVGVSLGIPIDATLVTPAVERIEELRDRLGQPLRTVQQIDARAKEFAAGEALTERSRQMLELATRVAATLTEVQERMGEFVDTIEAIQTKGQTLQGRIRTYIHAARACVILLFVWMAAGQVALFRNAWKAYRRIPA